MRSDKGDVRAIRSQEHPPVVTVGLGSDNTQPPCKCRVVDFQRNRGRGGTSRRLREAPGAACRRVTHPPRASRSRGRAANSERAPVAETDRRGAPGLHELSLEGAEPVLLYVPASYEADAPMPLVVCCMGAGCVPTHSIGLARARADRLGFMVLALGSRDQTWNLIAARQILSRTVSRTGCYRSIAAAGASWRSSGRPATRSAIARSRGGTPCRPNSRPPPSMYSAPEARVRHLAEQRWQ